MGPCSRTPSGPAVSTDCINRPDRRLHPTNATASIYLLQRGSHPQKTQLGRRGMSEWCQLRTHALILSHVGCSEVEFTITSRDAWSDFTNRAGAESLHLAAGQTSE